MMLNCEPPWAEVVGKTNSHWLWLPEVKQIMVAATCSIIFPFPEPWNLGNKAECQKRSGLETNHRGKKKQNKISICVGVVAKSWYIYLHKINISNKIQNEIQNKRFRDLNFGFSILKKTKNKTQQQRSKQETQKTKKKREKRRRDSQGSKTERKKGAHCNNTSSHIQRLTWHVREQDS